MSAAALTRAKVNLNNAQEALAEAQANLDALTNSPGVEFANDYPRGTTLWIRRASKSDDRIPMVAVRHSKGWTVCGVLGHLSWAEMKRRYLSEPLTWFSVQSPESAMGDNQIK